MVSTEDNKYILTGPKPLQPLLDVTLGELIYNNLKEESRFYRTALVDAVTSECLSYGELLKKSCLLAESLLRNGYTRNTIISICSENNLEFFIPIISALYIGAITAPLNQNYTDGELDHCLNITKPRIIFCSKITAPKYLRLKQDTRFRFIEKIIIIDGEEDLSEGGCETMNMFIARSNAGRDLEYVVRKFQVDNKFDPKEQTAFVMCSSGTTGLPKGVMLTHTNCMVKYMHNLDPKYIMPIEEGAALLGILPFFHGYGLITNFFSIVQGQKIVVLKKFDEHVFLKAIQDYKISILYLAPPLVVFLAKSPLVEKYDLSSVIEIVSGAAPLSKQTEELVKKRLNIKILRQGYGLTEATLAVFLMTIGDERFGSSGKVISYMTCKVRDPETGKSLPPKIVGELCFKGPMVMKGYFGNEEATRNSFTSDGWLLTGDLAYYDEDGYFYVVDRLKELIKYKGFQVAPAELEAILLGNPKIKDAGVVGIPKDDVGELPAAFVVKNPNVKLTEKEVEEYVAGKVSAQKKIRGGVFFVSAIPRNLSGKILRRELRKMMIQYTSSKL